MIHNTHVSQFIPPTAFHCVTGTWTEVAGQVADTVVKHVAATDEVSVINIPILIPSNSIALQGAKLVSVEIDYEILVAACDSVTPVINKVTRGIEGAVAVVATQAFSQSPTAANSKTVDQHKLVLTLTTPIWIDNDEYVLVKISADKAATTTMDFLGAVANFTLRV